MFASARVPPPIAATYRQSAVSSANSAAYTFPGLAIGDPSPTRRVVVGVAWRTGGGTLPLTSVTIGGIPASVDVQPGGANSVAIVSAVVPTGTTADVVVTLPETTARCGIGVWTLNDGEPTGQTAQAAVSLTLDLTVATSAGNVVIAVVATSTAGDTFTWSGASERYDQVVEAGFDHSGADAVAAGSSTPVTVTASTSSTTRGCAAAYA